MCGTTLGNLSSGTNRPNMVLSGITGSPITYTWNPGSFVGLTYNVCPTTDSVFTVTASLPTGCTATASVTVDYDPVTVPTITAGGPLTFCEGGSVTLDAGAGYATYSWDSAGTVVGTSQTFNAAPSATTTYTVTVSNGGTCTASASETVTVSPLTPPTISSNGPTTFCDGGDVILDAGAGYSGYSWDNGSMVVGTSQTYTATVAGTYTVTVTSGNGCSASASAVVIVNANPPTASITPAGPIDICDDGSDSPVTLVSDTSGAGFGASILWNDLNGTTTETLAVSAGDLDLFLNGGTYGYNFTVTNADGCSSTSNTVTINEVPCGSIVTLTTTVFLEGYYEEAVAFGQPAGQMNDNIGGGGLLYYWFGSPYTYNQVDSITISAMDATTYGLVDSQTGIIDIFGNVTVTFGPSVVAGNSYYIRVTHRNSIETWSANPVSFTPVSSYDFTASDTMAYGSNQVQTSDGLYYAIFSGDISDSNFGVGTQDGVIESQDYSDMENAVNSILFGYVVEDITGDAIVESLDYSIMENNVNAIRFSIHP
jgi:hypothetical protein